MSSFVLQGKPGTRLASSEIVSDQLDHCSAFSTEREREGIWSVARFYGLTATTDKRKRRERASVSLCTRNFERENGFAVGEKVAKKKGERDKEPCSNSAWPVSFEEARSTLPHKGKTSRNVAPIVCLI